MTWQDLIDQSFRLIGELGAPGRTMNTIEYADALIVVNQLLATLSAEQIVIPQVIHDTFPLTGTAFYTFGLTGVFNTARPLRLISVASLNAAGASAPVQLVDAVQWNAIPDKTRTGLFVESLHDDGAYPLRKLYVSPMPAAGTLHIISDKPLTSAVSLVTVIDLNPGFEQMLRYNLAIELAGEYERAIPANVMAGAIASKAAIANLNRQAIGGLGAPAPMQQPPQPQGANQ